MGAAGATGTDAAAVDTGTASVAEAVGTEADVDRAGAAAEDSVADVAPGATVLVPDTVEETKATGTADAEAVATETTGAAAPGTAKVADAVVDEERGADAARAKEDVETLLVLWTYVMASDGADWVPRVNDATAMRYVWPTLSCSGTRPSVASAPRISASTLPSTMIR